jgi:hypothetical protein
LSITEGCIFGRVELILSKADLFCRMSNADGPAAESSKVAVVGAGTALLGSGLVLVGALAASVRARVVAIGAGTAVIGPGKLH